TQGKYSEAESLYKRSLATEEKILGPSHPAVATTLCNWAVLLAHQVNNCMSSMLFGRS
ncbi:unnamed protein product, partial [Scytosiphon promiscuus]